VEVRDQIQASESLTQGEEPQYPVDTIMGEHQSRFGVVKICYCRATNPVLLVA